MMHRRENSRIQSVSAVLNYISPGAQRDPGRLGNVDESKPCRQDGKSVQRQKRCRSSHQQATGIVIIKGDFMKLAFGIIIVVVLVAGGAAYYTVYVAAEPPTNFRTVTSQPRQPTFHDHRYRNSRAGRSGRRRRQVVGRIKDFGLDPSDPDGKKRISTTGLASIHEGTELAYIDDAVYKAQLDQAKPPIFARRPIWSSLKPN